LENAKKVVTPRRAHHFRWSTDDGPDEGVEHVCVSVRTTTFFSIRWIFITHALTVRNGGQGCRWATPIRSRSNMVASSRSRTTAAVWVLNGDTVQLVFRLFA